MELKSERRGLEGLDACLLIVPYGIEITLIRVLPPIALSFNRTLWN